MMGMLSDDDFLSSPNTFFSPAGAPVGADTGAIVSGAAASFVADTPALVRLLSRDPFASTVLYTKAKFVSVAADTVKSTSTPSVASSMRRAVDHGFTCLIVIASFDTLSTAAMPCLKLAASNVDSVTPVRRSEADIVCCGPAGASVVVAGASVVVVVAAGASVVVVVAAGASVVVAVADASVVVAVAGTSVVVVVAGASVVVVVAGGGDGASVVVVGGGGDGASVVVVGGGGEGACVVGVLASIAPGVLQSHTVFASSVRRSPLSRCRLAEKKYFGFSNGGDGGLGGGDDVGGDGGGGLLFGGGDGTGHMQVVVVVTGAVVVGGVGGAAVVAQAHWHIP